MDQHWRCIIGRLEGKQNIQFQLKVAGRLVSEAFRVIARESRERCSHDVGMRGDDLRRADPRNAEGRAISIKLTGGARAGNPPALVGSTFSCSRRLGYWYYWSDGWACVSHRCQLWTGTTNESGSFGVRGITRA